MSTVNASYSYAATQYQAQVAGGARAGQVQASFSLAAYAGSASFAYSGASSTADSAAAVSGEDSARISLEAYAKIRSQYAQDVYSLLFPSKASTGSGAYKSLEEVGMDFQNDFNDIAGLLGTMFQSAGLELEPPISLKLDGQGHVLATTADGQKNGDTAKSDAIFSGDSRLVGRFAVMAARGALSQAGSSVPGFADAYAEDGPAAIREYIGDLESLLFRFSLNAGKGGIGYSFD